MIPSSELLDDLRRAVATLERQPLIELLLQRGILRELVQQSLLERLRDSVQFSPAEEPLLLKALWEGVPGNPPAALRGDWIATLPESLRAPLRQRWDQLRQQKWIEEHFQDQVEPYFLERRKDLEQVVYGLIRHNQQGTAEELYLRLLDDAADFGDLARQYSLGEERFTRGLVGPMLISQPHPTIRAVLESLAVGEIHPPFMVDRWVLLVKMEYRQPASLNEATRLQLYNELFQRELEARLDACLAEIYPQLLPPDAITAAPEFKATWIPATPPEPAAMPSGGDAQADPPLAIDSAVAEA
jgi:hypothetical protein